MSNPNHLLNERTKQADGPIKKHADTCYLCGLSLPKYPIKSDDKNSTLLFCCTGCMQVYNLIAEDESCNIDFKSSDLFQTCIKLGIIANPGSLKETEQSIPEKIEGSEELSLHIEGMWCSSCSWLIEKVLTTLPGVAAVRIIYASDTAKIFYQPEKISAPEIIKTIAKLGYTAASSDQRDQAYVNERNSLLLRMGISLFLMMNILFLSFVLYIGYFQDLPNQIKMLVPYLLFFLSLVVIFWCGLPIHKKAFQSVINRAPTMEVLFSISIIAAFIFSVFAIYKKYDHVYFDTASSLVTLFLIGKFIENSAKHKATENIARLYKMMPKKARLKTPLGNRLVSVKELKVHSFLIVKEGEKIPCDGRVVQGTSLVDESLLTGESKPIEKRQGSLVTASSMNLSGTIEVETLKPENDSVLANTIKMVERALNNKSDLEQTVDRISRFFIPAVIILAFAVSLILYSMGYGFETAMLRAMAVLVIACPCALGLATPLSISIGVGTAASMGILVRDFNSFNLARKVDTIVFDKTGTLTKGSHTIRDFYHPSQDENQALKCMGSIEQASNHPIGHSILKICRERKISFFDTKNVLISNNGIEGYIIDENVNLMKKVYGGNQEFIRQKGFLILSDEQKRIKREEKEGHTVLFFAVEGDKYAGFFSFGDTLKDDAMQIIKYFQANKISIILLSGDSLATTRAIARQIGIENFIAEAKSENKISKIIDLQKAGKVVAMVGDGINDTPALAQADIGITVRNGIELAHESSAITLQRDDLNLINNLLSLSGRTMRTIHQNLTWAFLYNAIGIALAVGGILNPLISAAAMLASSLSVIGNSLRISWYRAKENYGNPDFSKAL